MGRTAVSRYLLPTAQAETAASIPIGILVARPQDFPGFGPVVREKPLETIYALEWALTSEGSTASAEREAAMLKQWGFESGIQIVLVGRKEGTHERREAVSVGMVFSTSVGATEELAVETSAGRKAFAKVLVKGAKLLHGGVPGIPDSAQFGEGDRSGAVDNVLFSVGRCYFVVGDSLKRRSTAYEVGHPLRSAAVAVYRRAKAACTE
jgi:hypothetical protein